MRPIYAITNTKMIVITTLLILIGANAATAQPTMQMNRNTNPTTAEAQKIFDQMRSLEGTWLGTLTAPGVENKLAHVVLRTTSRGNAILHEMNVTGLPDDPITMFYLEGEQLLMTHYCDAGNRPRMKGTISADAKTIEYDIIDLAGGERKGHMTNVVFKFIDANHHTEDWTLMMTGVDKPIQAHFDLQRVR